MTPVIAVLIGVLVMKETITQGVYIGSALVLLGVLFTTLGDVYTRYRRHAD